MRLASTLLILALVAGCAASTHAVGAPSEDPLATATSPSRTFSPNPTSSESAGASPSATTSFEPSPSPSVAAPSATATPTTAAYRKPALSLRLIADELSNPVYVTHAGRSSDLFIVEQNGAIKIRHAAGRVATFLDLTWPALCCGERGLLGLAFHPDYESSGSWGYGRFYVAYTRDSTNVSKAGDLVIREYRRSAVHPDRANAASGRTLLVIEHSETPYHYGGSLNFGPDGFLYIGTGDGGGVGDPHDNAQNKQTLLGKLLRIDVHPGSSRPYSIPRSNPFFGSVAGRDEIWSYGLRNPWRFSFDSASGDLWIGDVGEMRYEEINLAPSSARSGRGVNFGWDAMEGNHCFEPAAGCSMSGKHRPLVQYPHAAGAEPNCAVVAGYVYHGAQPALAGRFLYADYCSGRIWSWTRKHGVELLADTTLNVSSFGLGAGGELYLTALDGGVYRITAS
jgi:glucose/arabinose dehydrogenase